MQLFELVSPRLFRPLAGPNRAFYAELLLLLWEECRHTADYSISRAEAVSRAEDYFAALAKPLALDADGAGDEDEQPTRDPHTLAVGFLLRLRRTGWLEEQPGSYESEPTLAFMPEVTPLLDALEEILNPRVVTYTGKLYKAWQLLGSIGQEKSPYENVLREVAADLETLNKSLRALNASIGHYIDRLTHNRTPQEVLELFDQYEEKVVAAAYHRFKTSDNLFNYRAYLEEELDDCEQNQLPRLALDYARVERCAPGEAAPRVRALIQQQRDALEEMSTLMKEIDASHIRYRKRAVQRAQFLLLSDRSAQGSVTALLRRYAEDIRSPEQLFEPDDGPVAARLHLYPAAVFGAKPLYPPAAPRTEAPLAPVRTEPLDPDRLRQEHPAFYAPRMLINHRPRPLSGTTVINIMNLFCTFLHWCKKMRYSDNEVYALYGCKEPTYGDPFFLTSEERNILYDADLNDNPKLAVIRDIFVFHCYVGCRVGDLYRLTRDNIKDGFLEYMPQKTKKCEAKTVRVPLHEKALKILERYDANADRLFPFRQIHTYNLGIRELLKRCGIDRMVTILDTHGYNTVQKPLYEVATSHTARKTFVGNLYRQVPDPNLIASMSGHVEGSRAFSRYRTIDDDMKRRLVDMID